MDENLKSIVDASLARVTNGVVDKEIRKDKYLKVLKYIVLTVSCISLPIFIYFYYDPNIQKPSLDFQLPETIYKENGEIQVRVKQDNYGHYTFVGEINGIKVDFLLDTGATNVSIPQKVARFIKLPFGKSYFSNTAKGKSLSYHSSAEVVAVGGISLYNVEASISTGMEGDEILLGMSFLKNLEVVQKNGELIISAKKIKTNHPRLEETL